MFDAESGGNSPIASLRRMIRLDRLAFWVQETHQRHIRNRFQAGDQCFRVNDRAVGAGVRVIGGEKFRDRFGASFVSFSYTSGR